MPRTKKSVEKKEKSVDIWAFLSDINWGKKNIMTPENRKEYNSFMMNRILSMSHETVFYANEMNQYNMKSEDNYRFYLHAIPQKKRFIPYLAEKKLKNLKYITQYYNISDKQGMEYLDLLTDEQINEITKKVKQIL